MPELFGLDLAGIVNDALGDGLLAVTLSKPNPGGRQAGDLTGGRVPGAPTIYSARGFWEDFTGTPPPGVEILVDDRKAVVLGASLPAGVVPERGWQITIEGVTQTIVRKLNRDPAAAVYTFQCRDRLGPDQE